MSHDSAALQHVAGELRTRFLHQPFGAIRFWRFAVVRPHDQSFELIDARVASDRLNLVFRHVSGQGQAGLLSVWAPQGLSISERGVVLQEAARLRLDDNQAWAEGDDYRIRTPRGEGTFPRTRAAALTLES
ncbi:MAG: hypothetical protein AB3X44_01850 [Leptothrix sp. (in: b-proteobacteria)]